MKSDELDRLIDDCLEGVLTEADAARLNALLQDSPDARARYWEMASVHGLMENALQQASLRVITGQAGSESNRTVTWLQWRPWTAAAAGLVFGILSASMVWAFAMPAPKGTVEQAIPIFSEGFENSLMTPERGFPRRANEWFGDLSAPVIAEAEVVPVEGARMIRLVPSTKRKLSYARRVIDMEEYPSTAPRQTRRIEVSACFNAPGATVPSHYQVRLAAFSQEPSALRAIWNDEPLLFDTVLQHVGRNMHVSPGDRSWQTMRAAMDIPPGTRSVVISLAAGESSPESSLMEHYLDHVQARFVITQATAE